MKTIIEFRKQNIPFTQVSNEVLKDTKLSFKAKGLYAYIYSKPEDWQFSFERIAKETADGQKAILTAIDELEKAGLLRRLKQPDGRTIYWVTYPPSQFDEDQKPTAENRKLAKKPTAEKAYLPKSQLAILGTISNKELNTNKDIDTNKEREHSPKEIALNFFSVVNEDGDSFSAYVSSLGIPSTLARQEIKKFVDYWTEPNSTGTKQRWQMQETFEVQRRLRTWFSKVKGFQGGQFTNKYQATTV